EFYIPNRKRLPQNGLQQTRRRLREEERPAARPVLVDQIPSAPFDLDVAAYYCIDRDCEHLTDRLLNFIVTAELRRRVGKSAGRDDRPPTVVELRYLKGGRGGQRVPAGNNQHPVLLAILTVVQDQFAFTDDASRFQHLGVKVGIVHPKPSIEGFAHVHVIDLRRRDATVVCILPGWPHRFG